MYYTRMFKCICPRGESSKEVLRPRGLIGIRSNYQYSCLNRVNVREQVRVWILLSYCHIYNS